MWSVAMNERLTHRDSPSLPKHREWADSLQSGLLTMSKYPSEGEIDASGTGQRVLPVLERRDAVIDEACGTAPHHDVTAFEVQAAH